MSLTAVFLGQQRVKVQFYTGSSLNRSLLYKLLCLGVCWVQGLDGAPGGGVKFREFRGKTLPHQEVAEVPDRCCRKWTLII